MLRYDEIELSDFTGMWLNNTTYFKMTFKEIITLILGRNGSGKSRLINQLCPLCPEKLDFRDGGFKRMVLTHDNTQYELRFNKVKNSYKCYIKNLTTGEEITNGSNPTVHNTLMRDMFNYDKDLHLLFTGKVLLTDIKAPERKKWFSKLSTSDLNFALNFFKKAKENMRDITGTIKTLKVSITELRPRVIEDSETLALTAKRLTVLQQDISNIDIMLSNLKTDPNVTPDVVLTHLRALESSFKQLAHLDVTKDPAIGNRSSEDVSVSLERINTTRRLLAEQLVKLEEVLNRSKQLETVDIGALEQQLDERTVASEDFKIQVNAFTGLLEYSESELRTSREQIRSHAPRLIELMSHLDCEYSGGSLSQSLKEADERSGVLQQDINVLSNRISSQSSYMKTLQSIAEVECGKCSHRFKPGVRANEIECIQAELSKKGEELESAKQKLVGLNKTRERLTELVGYSNNLRDLINYLSGYTPIRILIDELSSVGAFRENQASYAGIIHTYVSEIEYAYNYSVNKPHIDRLNGEIAIAKATQQNDTSALLREKALIDHQMETLDKEQETLVHIRSLINDYDNRMTKLDSRIEDFNNKEARTDELEEILLNNIDAEVLLEQKQELWALLTETKQRYDTMQRELNRLEDQEKQLADLEIRLVAAKQVVHAMSPEGGLLAKYLYNSVTRITELMSEYINRMWGYDMHIMPCDVSDGDMDYLFPFWAGTKDKINADVSMGSRGQRDVINFVFMLAVYRAMNLEAYPILIDEALSSFDESHRTQAIEFIKHLIATGRISQVMMVSHDATTHFQLTHADVCVIDPEGVTLPPKYNTNVEIA